VWLNMSLRGLALFSSRIDESFRDLVCKSVHAALSVFGDGRAADREDEVQTLVDLAYYTLSFVALRRSPGAVAMGLQYRGSEGEGSSSSSSSSSSMGRLYSSYVKRHRLSIIVLVMLVVYAHKKALRHAREHGWAQPPPDLERGEDGSIDPHGEQRKRHGYWRALEACGNAYKVVKVLHYLNFLYQGRYPTMMYRLMETSLQPHPGVEGDGVRSGATVHRAVTYVRGRQLLWVALSELMGSVGTAVNWGELSTRLAGRARALSRQVQRWRPLSSTGYRTAEREQIVHRQQDKSHCGACGDTPEMPHVTSCGHWFCYYCLDVALQRARLLGEAHACNVCGSPNTICRPATERDTD